MTHKTIGTFPPRNRKKSGPKISFVELADHVGITTNDLKGYFFRQTCDPPKSTLQHRSPAGTFTYFDKREALLWWKRVQDSK